MRGHIAEKEVLGHETETVDLQRPARFLAHLAHDGLRRRLSEADAPADGVEVIDGRMADHQEFAVLENDRADADVHHAAVIVDAQILSHFRLSLQFDPIAL